MKDSEMLWIGGGALLLLYLMTRNSTATGAVLTTGMTPAQIAAQSQANNSAALIGAGTGLATSLANSLTNNSGGSSYTQYASYS
jgi:hypothetical protein